MDKEEESSIFPHSITRVVMKFPITQFLALSTLSLTFTGCFETKVEAPPEPVVVEEPASPPPLIDYPAQYAVAMEKLIAQDNFTKAEFKAAARALYTSRENKPVWLNAGIDQPAKLTAAVDLLTERMKNAHLEGLNPEDYPSLKGILSELRNAGEIPSADLVAQTDIAISTAFMKFASHLHSGRIDPEILDQEWTDDPRSLNLISVTSRAGEDKDSFETIYEELLPQYASYKTLRKTLAEYRVIAAHGGWGEVPSSVLIKRKLEKGNRGPGVALLRKRLIKSGDLAVPPAPPEGSKSAESDAPTKPNPVAFEDRTDFDADLKEAVESFQARHGLGVDGVIGENSLKAMNVPVETRIKQIILSMERHRWFPEKMGRRHIQVNIPEFHLRAYKDGNLHTQMRVIVGSAAKGTHTPIFNAKMKHIVFRPFWNIPRSIIKGEVLPLAEKGGRRWMDRMAYEIVDNSGKPLKSNKRGFEAVREGNAYIRQQAGGFNSLGLVKYLFPNEHHVYMHDTNQRHLFVNIRRDLSHGCIRLSDPAQMGVYALGWEKSRVSGKMSQTKRLQYNLRGDDQINVFIHYLTAFPVDAERVGFYRDIYRHDSRLADALRSYGHETKIAQN